jgi:hypothetical protein
MGHSPAVERSNWRFAKSRILKSVPVRWSSGFPIHPLPVYARAQVLYGSLTGNVTDPSSGAIPGVKVESAQYWDGVVRTAITDTSGYIFVQ